MRMPPLLPAAEREILENDADAAVAREAVHQEKQKRMAIVKQ